MVQMLQLVGFCHLHFSTHTLALFSQPVIIGGRCTDCDYRASSPCVLFAAQIGCQPSHVQQGLLPSSHADLLRESTVSGPSPLDSDALTLFPTVWNLLEARLHQCTRSKMQRLLSAYKCIYRSFSYDSSPLILCRHPITYNPVVYSHIGLFFSLLLT